MSEPVEKQIKGENTEENDYVLTLYVSGESPRSTSAIRNLKNICNDRLDESYTVEVVDIQEKPEAAEENNIVAVPTLIKRLPPPLRRIVGDLSKTEEVLYGLELQTQE